MGSQIYLNIQGAIKTIEARREEWKRDHPDEPEPVCPICKGTGLKMIIRDFQGKERPLSRRYDPGSYEYLEPCPCVKNAPSQKLLNDKKFSGVPSLYENALMSNFRQDIYNGVNSRETIHSAYSHVAFYINRFEDMLHKGIGLYIWSKSKGCGKTRLACTISNELSNRGYRNKYESASTILSEIQASWNDKTQNEHKIINNYIKPDLLIIDDLGAKSGQSWMDEKFFMIIDKRYQENKPTIVTSNYSVERLPFDGRITDRLQDIDRFVAVDMPNESVRDKTRQGIDSPFYQMVQEERERREKEKNGET